jgi:hypothetical protein
MKVPLCLDIDRRSPTTTQPSKHPATQQHRYSVRRRTRQNGRMVDWVRVGLIWWRGGCPKDGSRGTVGYGGVVAAVRELATRSSGRRDDWVMMSLVEWNCLLRLTGGN